MYVVNIIIIGPCKAFNYVNVCVQHCVVDVLCYSNLLELAWGNVAWNQFLILLHLYIGLHWKQMVAEADEENKMCFMCAAHKAMVHVNAVYLDSGRNSSCWISYKTKARGPEKTTKPQLLE